MIILGAGASGLFCAREAAGRGLRVLLLERAAAPGRKLALSGGGRANFTNRAVSPQDYYCRHGQEFCGPALASFRPEDMLRLMRAWNLPIEERAHGQLFLTVPAQRLVQALTRDCRERGCRLLCNISANGVSSDGELFHVQAGGTRWRGKALILALGSPAWPQAGGSGMGYRLAQSLGHTVIPPRPALAPLRLASDDAADAALLELAGVSLPVRISLPHMNREKGTRRIWEDDLLFTHEGLSGPAALKASLFWREGAELRVDFLPGRNVETLLDAPQAGRQTARTLLSRHLPQRLADALLPATLARRKIAELSRNARRQIAAAVQARILTPSGVAGLKKAEVCSGGVDACEIDPQTMRSLLRPNLHIIGELLDVTGLLGGYNLHWAWASGMAAGRSVLK
ncbi:NAD(P)/FAD-dependent oxidoreductase [Desulfovibrio sp. SGI.169]|uniref:NAD(P)/FAD-dependent oxidoreductase n=1 Tax=Desulfovibrio sp. SGI.169 TaxID=3420561 RepID=UPI003CFEA72C